MGNVKVRQIELVDLPDYLKMYPRDPMHVEPEDLQRNSCLTKVTKMGHITELLSMTHKSDGDNGIKKLSKDYYVVVESGEVKEYQHIENRAGSLESIRQTLVRIRGLINSNITDPERVRWVTLTYKENMMDTKQLYEDYRDFWKRFKYWNKVNGFGKPEYISVIEPQGRGAWHVHAFFIWPHVAPFVDNNSVLAPTWGHGFTSIKAFSGDNTNPGAYFSAYLADMPIDEFDSLSPEDKTIALATGCSIQDKVVYDDQGEGQSKKFVKGARLHFYPPGMNIIRSSRGVKRPDVQYMSLLEAKEKVSDCSETFSRTYHLYAEIETSDGNKIKNMSYYSKSYYNANVKKVK